VNRPAADPKRGGSTAGANPVVPMTDSSQVSIDNHRPDEERPARRLDSSTTRSPFWIDATVIGPRD
jgi:hypothetical protein